MISMVMPIYNEERLLPSHLDLAAPHVDQIILVDGSPIGPSDDATSDLIEKAQKYGNIKLITGTYEMNDRPGGWDRQAQISDGVAEAEGDWLLITSCDTLFADYEHLASLLKNAEGSVCYTYTREFFIDTDHLRLTPQGAFPLPLVGYVVFKAELFDASFPSYFNPGDLSFDEYIFLPDVSRFHYGWVVDFQKQIERQKRNVLSGLWKDYGETLLKGGEEALDVWAITCVTNYAKEFAFPYIGKEHPLDSLKFDYLEGFEDVLADFQSKYGKSYYEAI